mmetsp:Transcript_32427/g.103211  ORF Transcript_32427/g.103211 Transcript_32427/m.103211 type:complete len:234 (-) Transcript_32427:714-1415(-)
MMSLLRCRLTSASSSKDERRASSSDSSRSRDQIFPVSRVRETETSLVATTSTDTPASAQMLKTLARKPYWPSMRDETMSSMTTLDFFTMDVRRDSVMSRSSWMTVPGAEMLYEFFTRTLRLPPCSMAGRIACGCSTCAPKYDSSVASSYVSSFTTQGFSIRRGSAVSTPSTSFHTCTSERLRAFPMTVALRSEPPRPRVVMALLSTPRARNPVMMGRYGSSPSSRVRLSLSFA